MEILLITALSVLFQIGAVVSALRLIRVSRARTAWILICMAILGMAFRRGITLVRILAGESLPTHDMAFETLGLFTSLFLFLGITFITPIFHDIRKKEEERESLVRDLRESAAKVKTLTGLLPICASCKSIRDDKGYWKQMEEYIGSRTDAAFSHSICPECRKKLYPQFSR